MKTAQQRESERAMIARKVAEASARLRKQLDKVDRTGGAGHDTIERLWFAGLIELCGPSAAIEYNHYRLTPEGHELKGNQE